MISNSLTNFLDQKLHTSEEVDEFIDNLEDEIFGVSNRNFYLMYKGDIKELLDSESKSHDFLGFEEELLVAFTSYCKQRKARLR